MICAPNIRGLLNAVRTGLVLAEVGSKNEIEVTQEELNQGLIQRVQQFPSQEQQVFEYFQKNPVAMAQIRRRCLKRKSSISFVRWQM